MADRTVIDASALNGFNYLTYFAEYFQNGTAGAGARTYYGTTNTSSGKQAGFSYGSTPTDGSNYVLTESMGTHDNFGYSGRHGQHGGYDGDIDTINFGTFVEGETVIHTTSAGTTSLASGVASGLVISDLDISIARGAGGSSPIPGNYSDVIGSGNFNAIYALITWLKDAGTNATYIQKFYDYFGLRAQHFIGGDGEDIYTGTDHDDLIEGGAGDDTIEGGAGIDTAFFDGNFADYTFNTTPYTDDEVYTVNGGTTGTDTLTGIELLRFKDGTYDLRDGSFDEVPTDLTIDNTDVEGDAEIGDTVGLLSGDDNEDASDDLTFSLVDDGDGMFKIIDRNKLVVSDGLAAGSHTIKVKVVDSVGNTLVKELTINVSNIAPVISGETNVALSIAENGTVVTQVVSTDGNGRDTVTYTLSGADADLFQIDANGNLSFKSAPDFENAQDAGKNNVYDVVVRATDAGGLFDEQTFAVTVTNANEAPVITSNGGGSTAWFDINENSKAVTRITATDVDAGQTPQYSLSGADAALFEIDANGNLSFKSAPDFENAKDAGKNNVYDVTVRVSDGSLFDTQALKIEITDLNDNKPVFTSSSKVKIAENTKLATTVKATDADAGTKLSYALAGGADQGLFTIDSKTGALSFKSAPDFEAAKDANKNNVYEVTVKVSDGTNSTLQSLQVSVSDVKGVTMNGGNGNDLLIGTGEQDVLNGGKGNDTLKGGAADDRLYGGAGADKLYGEAGADTFVFRAKGDSTLATAGRDTIYGFDGKAGDRIDLSGFDANDTKSGLQDFSYIGAAKFSGKAGELRFEKVGTKTYVYADTNGDKTADFAINFDNSVNFQKDYFVL